jgi:hypothetical protein
MSPMIRRINAIYRLETIRRIVWYALVLSVVLGGYLWAVMDEGYDARQTVLQPMSAHELRTVIDAANSGIPKYYEEMSK